MSETSDFIRQSFKEGDDIRDRDFRTPETIERFDDIPYGPDAAWQMLDLYRPKNAKGKMLPVIISVHGGGWVYGDKDRYQYYCMSLAERGFAVVNFTYRLAPEFKFPAALEDTNLVAGWVLQNKEKHLLDTDHIFAVGDSAGAHYLSLFSCVLTNPGYASEYPFQVPEGFSLKAISLDCGAYCFSGIEGQTARLIEDLLPEGGSEEELHLITTLNHITEDYPPVFLFTSKGDFLKEEAPLLEQRLMECDVRHTFSYFTSDEEDLGHVFNLNLKLKAARECNDAQCSFFRQFL